MKTLLIALSLSASAAFATTVIAPVAPVLPEPTAKVQDATTREIGAPKHTDQIKTDTTRMQKMEDSEAAMKVMRSPNKDKR